MGHTAEEGEVVGREGAPKLFRGALILCSHNTYHTITLNDSSIRDKKYHKPSFVTERVFFRVDIKQLNDKIKTYFGSYCEIQPSGRVLESGLDVGA